MATIPKGSIVLVTGVNGYIASHVADQLLSAGYRVRGTVRSAAKGKWYQQVFDEKYGKGKFETVIVEDLRVEGAFDEAIKGVSGVIHLALPTQGGSPNEVISAHITGSLGILNSAINDAAHSIKSFVYTSSSCAVLTPRPNQKVIVTKDSWNEEAVEKARNDSNVDGYIVYAASKTEAEKAVWKFVEEKKPAFQVACILPNTNMGEILKDPKEKPSSTGSWIPMIYKGEIESILPYGSQYYVNVKDTARLHVAALTDPSQNNNRLFAFAATYTYNEILAILRKLYPNKEFIDDIPDEVRDLTVVPNEDAEELLRKHFGKGFAGLEETIKENLKGIV